MAQRDDEKKADAARDKLACGQKPTQAEMNAWRRIEKQYLEHYGCQYLAAVPKAKYCEWSGKEYATIYQQADKHGIPIRDRSVSIPAVVRWIHTHIGKLSRGSVGIDEELEPGVNDGSPQLERLRAAKADLAEYERDKKLGELAPVSEFKSFLVQWSSRLRQAGEVMAKPTCADPHAVFLDALADCEQMILEKYPDVQGDITG